MYPQDDLNKLNTPFSDYEIKMIFWKMNPNKLKLLVPIDGLTACFFSLNIGMWWERRGCHQIN